MSNQWFDWEDLDEKETEWGIHGRPFHETVGKPVGDTFCDWDYLTRVRGMQD